MNTQCAKYIILWRRHRSQDTQIEGFGDLIEAKNRMQVLLLLKFVNSNSVALYEQHEELLS